MSIVGWYYLHTNGELLYKRDLDGTAADIRESTFARAMWPLDPQDRAGAWRILVEASALKATPERVKELAGKWGCDDEDAKHYAEQIGINLFMDGNAWCATRKDFKNLQESPSGFGNTCLEAMAELCSELGYRSGKMWNAEFTDLVKVREAASEAIEEKIRALKNADPQAESPSVSDGQVSSPSVESLPPAESAPHSATPQVQGSAAPERRSETTTAGGKPAESALPVSPAFLDRDAVLEEAEKECQEIANATEPDDFALDAVNLCLAAIRALKNSAPQARSGTDAANSGGHLSKPAESEPLLVGLPIEVRFALMTLLNHIEPGWDNCKAVVNNWLRDSEKE